MRAMPVYHPLVKKRRTKQFNRQSLNQKDLAHRLGIEVSKMGRYERGAQIPDYDDAVKLGNYFDMSWNQIVEMCVEFRDRQKEFVKFFSSKNSESSGYSHVCTRETEKCGAR